LTSLHLAARTLHDRSSGEPTAGVLRRQALSWPARQIAINAGDDGAIVVGKILEKDTYAYG